MMCFQEQINISLFPQYLTKSKFWVKNLQKSDASGQVIDRGLATKSIKDLAYYLRQHAGSVKNLQEHMGN